MNTYITDIQNNGELIILSDFSKWKVSSFDAFNTRMWMRMDNVVAENNALINTSRRNEKVSATRAF